MGRCPSYVFEVNGGEERHHGLRKHPAFLELQMTEQEALRLIEWLAYRLSHNQPITQVFSGRLVEKEVS